MKTNNIIILGTGGTIDANKYLDLKNPPKIAKMNSTSKIPELLDYIKAEEVFYIDFSFKKDSKKFNQFQLEKLADAIQALPSDKIIITHGTDVMPANARKIQQILEQKSINKTVIFTGAYIPIANGLSISDAPKNIKSAIDYLKNTEQNSINAQPKVLIAMESKIFEDITYVIKGKNEVGEYKFYNSPEAFERFKNLFVNQKTF